MQAGELLGRTVELDAIDAFLERVALGLEALVIEGEPGIGKTTLWRAALERARDASLEVLSAGPVGAEAQLGFAALADLLEPVADGILPSLPEPQRRALAVALLREAPGRRRIDQRTISSASLSLLRELASRGPILVAVDDLQWLRAKPADMDVPELFTPYEWMLLPLAGLGEPAAPRSSPPMVTFA
jgi:hypothetical protein